MISESKLQEFIVQNYKIGNDQIDLSLKYITLGKLNKNKDNLIIFPTRFAGTYQDQNYLIGSNQFLNPITIKTFSIPNFSFINFF